MSARTNSRFCPLCTIEIKESRLVPQHVYIEHAHSGTKPLSLKRSKFFLFLLTSPFFAIVRYFRRWMIFPAFTVLPGKILLSTQSSVIWRASATDQPQFLASAKHRIANMQLALVSVHVRLCLLVLTLLQPDSLPAMRK